MIDLRAPGSLFQNLSAERYSPARQAAGALLLRQRLYSLSIDVAGLRYERRVVFSSYHDFCRRTKMTAAEIEGQAGLRDGCTLVMERGGAVTYVILYNHQLAGLRRRNFTLAHEIGHIYLNHQDDTQNREAEANAFASELLMPLALLAELKNRAGRDLLPDDICPVFRVSRQAASVGVQRLSAGWFPTETDRRLLGRFGGLLPSPDEPLVDI